MSYPINYPTPQNANVQLFSIGGSESDWVKPQGCSFVYFTLIGAGGNGFGGNTAGAGAGGPSGAIVNSLVPSFLIPDQLKVYVGAGGVGNTTANQTRIVYQQKDGTGYSLLIAQSAPNSTSNTGATGPTVTSTGPFYAVGISDAVNGTTGGNAGGTPPNVTQLSTILSPGAGGAGAVGNAGASVIPLFNYPTLSGGAGGTGGRGRDGISILSNLILSCGGAGGGGSSTAAGGNGGNAGFGSGGGGGGQCTTGTSQGGRGGNGLVVIVSW